MTTYREIHPSIYDIPLGYVHAYLIAEEDGLTLVDSGLKGNDKQILKAVSELSRKPEQIRNILITHHHADHCGALKVLIDKSGADAWVHPIDAPIVAGEKPRPDANRGSIAGRMFGGVIARLPQNNPAPAKPSREANDGDVVPVAGGLRTIHTPGHTLGSVAFMMEGHGGVLFAGDAAAHMFGRLGKPALIFTEDMAQARASMRKLAALEFDTACFGHGGFVTGKAHTEFKRYVEKMAK